MADEKTIAATQKSLERIQMFDPDSIARTDILGTQLSFDKAVGSAKRLVNLYKRVPSSILPDILNDQLQQIGQVADADFNRFEQILEFSAEQDNAASIRSTLMQQLTDAYDNAFRVLWQFIAFSVATVTDTSVLESRARAVLQSIEDKAKGVEDELGAKREEADAILKNIQAVAAEQGVSQQAEYFKRAADSHDAKALWWRNATAIGVGVTLLFALVSAIAYKIPWLRPTDELSLVEFISGRIIIFLTLAAVVALCARNFLAHQHNVVLNRHRQTALQTYKVLVDAGSSGSQDIVLAHAAACIFSPQDTGFTKDGGEAAGSRSVLELMTKSVSGTSSAH